MVELGQKRVSLWFTPGEFLQLEVTAKAHGLAVSAYIRNMAVAMSRHPQVRADRRGNVEGVIFQKPTDEPLPEPRKKG